jgi:hypothetical protein
MRISRDEVEKLNELYRLANVSDGNEDWIAIQKCMTELGKKYDFEPRDVYITKFGKILETKRCFKCNNGATTTEGTIYVRDKVDDKWQNLPICWTCYARFYPERAFKETE